MTNEFTNLLPPGGDKLIEAMAEDPTRLDPYLHEADSRLGENGYEFKLPEVIGILPIRNAVAYPGTVTRNDHRASHTARFRNRDT